MKKFVLAPDSFKGTLSARQLCDGMEAVLLRHFPEAQVIRIPAADGGEGLESHAKPGRTQARSGARRGVSGI